MVVKESRLNTTLLLIIAVILIGVILRYTASVFIPFSIAIVCLYIFTPVLRFLKSKLRFPRILAVVVVLLIFSAVSLLVGFILYSSLRSLVGQYPVYEQRFITMISNLAESYSLTELNTTLFFDSLRIQDTLRQVLISLSGGSISFLSGFMLVTLFLLFLLLEEGSLVRNAMGALSEEQGARIRKIIKDVNDKVGQYMLAKLFISFCTATVVYIGFLLIGVDFPFVWGLLAFLFNFIPSIGSIIITVLASLFAIIQFAPNWGAVLLAAGLIAITEITFGNIIEPRLVGKHLNISTVVILLSLLIWAIIWGVAGMFLSIPMTVLIISILDAIPLTRPISTMMGAHRMPSYKKQKVS